MSKTAYRVAIFANFRQNWPFCLPIAREFSRDNRTQILNPNPQDCFRFYVYGTLKRGQCREKCWPATPKHICEGWTLGRLYDLGEYPAMVQGSDWVRGEVWEFDIADVPAVLQTLDEIEGTNQPGSPNLYDRGVCQVRISGDQSIDAYAYRYAHAVNTDQYIEPVRRSGALNSKSETVWPRT